MKFKVCKANKERVFENLKILQTNALDRKDLSHGPSLRNTTTWAWTGTKAVAENSQRS